MGSPEVINMTKICPLDGKRCYVKDPYKNDPSLRLIGNEPLRCRHGEFWDKCPAWDLLHKRFLEGKI